MKRYYFKWHNTVSGVSGAAVGTAFYCLLSAADECAALAAFNALTDGQKISQSTSTVPAAGSGLIFQTITCSSASGSPSASNAEVVVTGSNGDYTAPLGSNPAPTESSPGGGSGTTSIINGNPSRMALRTVDKGNGTYSVVDDAPDNVNYRYSINGEGFFTRSQMLAMSWPYGVPLQVHMLLTNPGSPSYAYRTEAPASTNAQSLINPFAPTQPTTQA